MFTNRNIREVWQTVSENDATLHGLSFCYRVSGPFGTIKKFHYGKLVTSIVLDRDCRGIMAITNYNENKVEYTFGSDGHLFLIEEYLPKMTTLIKLVKNGVIFRAYFIRNRIYHGESKTTDNGTIRRRYYNNGIMDISMTEELSEQEWMLQCMKYTDPVLLPDNYDDISGVSLHVLECAVENLLIEEARSLCQMSSI